MVEREKAQEILMRIDLTGQIKSRRGVKQCALILVDEMLANIDATILYHNDSQALPINRKYWVNVRDWVEILGNAV